MERDEEEEEEVVRVVRLARRQRLEEWVPPGWSPPGIRRNHPGSTPEEEGFHISEDSETDSLNSEPMSEGEEEARRKRNDKRALQRDRRAANPAFLKANKEWDRLLLEYEKYEEEMETARGENLANLRAEHDREQAAAVLKENNQYGDPGRGENGHQSVSGTLRQQPEAAGWRVQPRGTLRLTARCIEVPDSVAPAQTGARDEIGAPDRVAPAPIPGKGPGGEPDRAAPCLGAPTRRMEIGQGDRERGGGRHRAPEGRRKGEEGIKKPDHPPNLISLETLVEEGTNA